MKQIALRHSYGGWTYDESDCFFDIGVCTHGCRKVNLEYDDIEVSFPDMDGGGSTFHDFNFIEVKVHSDNIRIICNNDGFANYIFQSCVLKIENGRLTFY